MQLMYELWKDKHITLPSEFWNASTGDKIVLKAFHDFEIEETNRSRMEFKRNETPIFPVTIV